MVNPWCRNYSHCSHSRTAVERPHPHANWNVALPVSRRSPTAVDSVYPHQIRSHSLTDSLGCLCWRKLPRNGRFPLNRMPAGSQAEELYSVRVNKIYNLRHRLVMLYQYSIAERKLNKFTWIVVSSRFSNVSCGSIDGFSRFLDFFTGIVSDSKTLFCEGWKHPGFDYVRRKSGIREFNQFMWYVHQVYYN